MDNSNIPVLGHADGICHVYVDKAADVDMAVKVATDSKTQYVAVCNAAETILVHQDIAPTFLPKFKASVDTFNVEIFGCEKTRALIKASPANETSWKTEYLDYKVSVKVVASLNEAIDHINTYNSGHTESIITSDKAAVSTFMSLIDSGNIYWNTSTRFSDGFRYGLGAEVGVSTNKIHARGPVGMEGLLIYKWLLKGDGHIVADYSSGKKTFTHKKLNNNFML
jgi:glutamate-5-semialdehyde dehydrogenase